MLWLFEEFNFIIKGYIIRRFKWWGCGCVTDAGCRLPKFSAPCSIYMGLTWSLFLIGHLYLIDIWQCMQLKWTLKKTRVAMRLTNESPCYHILSTTCYHILGSINSQHNHDKARAVAWSQKKVIFISPWILLAFYSKFENWNENMGDLHLLGKWYSSRFDTMVIIVRGFGSPYNGAT